MLRKRVKQLKVIATRSAEEFEEQVNKAMYDLSEFEPELILRDSPGFEAVIIYEKRFEVIETTADEFEAAGSVYYCRHCPFCEKPMDGRRTWAHCPYAPGNMTNIKNKACEYFYNELKAGRIEV